MKQISLIGKIVLGNVLLALAVNWLIIPNQLISGGSTGLALALLHYFHWDFALITALINGLTFIAGWLCLGKKFALTTLLSSVIYPLIVKLTGLAPLVLSSDPLVAAVFGGVMMGAGLGLVIGAGASTGGLDIPVLIAQKMTGLSVSLLMYLMDSVILLLQLTFSPLQGIVNGIIMIAATTLMMNQVIVIGKSECQVFVVSEKQEAIRQAIIHDLDKGATMINIETGYLQEQTKGVLCVVSHRDLHLLQKTILELDPYAFMTISKIQEVNGRGFSLDKHLKKPLNHSEASNGGI